MMGHQSEGGAPMGQQPGGGSMMRHWMTGEGRSMMGHRGMQGTSPTRGHPCHIEGRLAFLKAEIKITPEQARFGMITPLRFATTHRQ